MRAKGVQIEGGVHNFVSKEDLFIAEFVFVDPHPLQITGFRPANSGIGHYCFNGFV